MSTDLERLTTELLGLPASSRAKLVKQLIASLDESDPAESESPDVQSRWLEVAKRRMAEIDEGKVECVPAEEVLRRARERLK